MAPRPTMHPSHTRVLFAMAAAILCASAVAAQVEPLTAEDWRLILAGDKATPDDTPSQQYGVIRHGHSEEGTGIDGGFPSARLDASRTFALTAKDERAIQQFFLLDQDGGVACRLVMPGFFKAGAVTYTTYGGELDCPEPLAASVVTYTPYVVHADLLATGATFFTLHEGPVFNAQMEAAVGAYHELTDPAAAQGTRAYIHQRAAIKHGAPAKHEPHVHLSPADVQSSSPSHVSVRGAGGSITKLHPQDYGNHWIEAVWVLDQFDRVILFANLTESRPDAPTMEFDPASVPGTSVYRPFSFCNKHGLWQGAPTLRTLPSLAHDADATGGAKNAEPQHSEL